VPVPKRRCAGERCRRQIEQIATNSSTNNTAVKVVVNVTGTSSAVAALILDLLA
jgi:hypothetical protein